MKNSIEQQHNPFIGKWHVVAWRVSSRDHRWVPHVKYSSGEILWEFHDRHIWIESTGGEPAVKNAYFYDTARRFLSLEADILAADGRCVSYIGCNRFRVEFFDDGNGAFLYSLGGSDTHPDETRYRCEIARMG